MKVVKFVFQYGHKERLYDNFGDCTGIADPITTIGTKVFILEDAYKADIAMAWAYIKEYLHSDDPLFMPKEVQVLKEDIAGVLKRPAYYLKDV